MTATTLDLDAIVAHASGIRGWMQEDELRWLAEQAAACDRILEVGAFAGRSTYALAAATPGHVVSLDTWVGEPDVPELAGDVLREAWRANLLPLIQEGRAFAYGLSLPQWIAAHPEGIAPFDFIFIDANHTYEMVLADCIVAPFLARPGAIVAGHDYWQEGVLRAVTEVFPAATGVLGGTIWTVTL